jgi:hypothetical protein
MPKLSALPGFLLSIFLLFLFPSIANAQVVINEMSTWETSGDWVELFSAEDINISGWKLRDGASTIIETVPQGISIGPSTSKYYVIEAGNRLNRDVDTIKILKSDDSTLVNEIDYGGFGQVCAAGSGESIGRYPDGNNTVDRFASPTKNLSNDQALLNPCPTPTPTPTPTSTATPTPTPIPSPTKTPTSTKTPTPKPTTTPEPEVGGVSDNNSGGGIDILGLRNQLANEESSPSGVEGVSNKKFPVFPVILIIVGAGLMGFAGYTLFKKMKSEGYNNQSEENN